MANCVLKKSQLKKKNFLTFFLSLLPQSQYGNWYFYFCHFIIFFSLNFFFFVFQSYHRSEIYPRFLFALYWFWKVVLECEVKAIFTTKRAQNLYLADCWKKIFFFLFVAKLTEKNMINSCYFFFFYYYFYIFNLAGCWHISILHVSKFSQILEKVIIHLVKICLNVLDERKWSMLFKFVAI
jgi:hypothetical protein